VTYAMTPNCHELFLMTLLITLNTSSYVLGGG
jgi:hypothetical protein